ncbi:energy-coupling factor transport system permease protein [Desulfotomaculum arcticum]|uniref:Energy-coupling factor transport system permease protein n=1 Tax=Desulfotruncus arcticus DSM 17038 TaxID=1121424 RepID=A0A1I2W634_9FIRM|nr:energy-coupling factor transporter transmembrane component T [Desulfotruncus arcticus]SFG95526.1 energy-coupling factor transport system permease protein [Desulfotomaculum arcticum] [Desulfotruncus arcticus DSM 17038]
MLNSITMGQYLPVDSPVHKMDPRAKLLVTALTAISVLAAASWPSLLAVSLWIGLVLAAARIKLGLYWQIYKPLWLLLLISLMLQSVFTPGEPIQLIGRLYLSKTGLAAGGRMLWQMAGLLLVAAVLTFSTTPIQLSTALERLLLPLSKLRVPVREFAMAINLALRFVPTLFDEARLLIAAQRARGADFTSGGIRQRVRGLIPFMIPLLTNIFRRADELAVAMEIRCYRTGAERSSITELKLKLPDYLAMSIAMIILFITLYTKSLSR